MNQPESALSNHIDDWFVANREYLLAFIDYAKYLIKTSYPEFQHERNHKQLTHLKHRLSEKRDAVQGMPPIEYLAELYGLSEFEKNILLLSVAPELDSSFLYPIAQDKPIVINFSLALAALPDADWGAIAMSGTLRRSGLLNLEKETSLTTAKIIIPESVLHFIVGIRVEDGFLQFISDDNKIGNAILDTQNEQVCERIGELLRSVSSDGPVLFSLTGEHAEVKRDIAAQLSSRFDLQLKIVPSFFIPSDLDDLRRFIITWNRECLLNNYLLLIEYESRDELDPARQRLIDYFIDRLDGIVICSAETKRLHCKKEQFIFEVSMPTKQDQRHYWISCLGQHCPEQELMEVCSHFDLSFRDIQLFARAYLSLHPSQSIWNICRQFNAQKMGSLAIKIDPSVGALHLVLPSRQKSQLDEIVAHVRLREKVYEDWGFNQNSSRGRGVTVLFSGSSGTGKTTAAEYLALKLELDLYRIDLSNIVSKYIGETEKNLQQIFAAAEKAGSILLFDEADSLFSKRTQVKDSHDKHANSEISYLLQRIESFKGLAILTTNLKDSFDKAFLRRLRFIVQFPFPSREEREKIWKATIPARAPLGAIDFSKLSRLNMAGGNIRNITMNACFLAAAEQENLQMKHFLSASRAEYEKLDMQINVEEVYGWV